MNKEQIDQLKKTRDSISCSLSTLRRELDTAGLSDEQVKRKVNRGIKSAEKFQELTNQLLQEGCKLSAKSPYLTPDWWRNYHYESNKPIHVIAPIIDIQEAKIAPPPPVQFTNIESIIKNAFKEVLNEQEYIFNIAWTEGVGDDNSKNNTLSIIHEYFEDMNIGVEVQESMGNERVRKYKYCGSECNILKRTVQFFIDKWGNDTDVSIFCKKNSF